MSSFTDHLELIQLDGDKWETGRDLVYYTDTETYIVPKGTITDGASIPRFLWSLVGHPLQEYAPSAVLHDYLYQTGMVPRDVADNIFYNSMAVLNVSWMKRKTLYYGVRLFGGFFYNNN